MLDLDTITPPTTLPSASDPVLGQNGSPLGYLQLGAEALAPSNVIPFLQAQVKTADDFLSNLFKSADNNPKHAPAEQIRKAIPDDDDHQKVMRAILPRDQGGLGLMPSSQEFYDALGVTAAQNNLIPTAHLGPFGPLRDAFSNTVQNLMRKRQALDVLGEAYLAQVVKQRATMMLSPKTVGEASSMFGPEAMPLNPNQVGRPQGPMPGTGDVMPPQGINPEAPLSLAQQYLGGQFLEAQGNMQATRGPGGSLEPTSIASMQGRFITPEQSEAAALMAGTPLRPEEVPQVSMPAQVNREALAQRGQTQRQLLMPRNVDVENRVATAMFKKPFMILDNTRVLSPADVSRLKTEGYAVQPGLTEAQAVDQFIFSRQSLLAEKQAAGRITAQLDAPATAQEKTHLFDRKAFVEQGLLRQAHGPVSEREARQDYLYVTDKNLDQLTAVDKSGEVLSVIQGLSTSLFKAATPEAALIQAAKYYATVNPLSRVFVDGSTEVVYADALGALSNSLAKAFGGEVGVLTNVDVQRWVRAMPKATDTQEITTKKNALTEQLYAASQRAQRRQIAGDTTLTEKKEIQALLTQLEQVGSAKQRGAASTLGNLTPDEAAVAQSFKEMQRPMNEAESAIQELRRTRKAK